jgi:hypothetical protein
MKRVQRPTYDYSMIESAATVRTSMGLLDRVTDALIATPGRASKAVRSGCTRGAARSAARRFDRGP